VLAVRSAGGGLLPGVTCVHRFDDESWIDEATTQAVAENFCRYWAVQDVEQTVALLSENVISVVHLDDSARGMSGVRAGRDAIAEGLYGNLATWHYLKFAWKLTGVKGETARVHIAFDYMHQRTGLRHEGTMRKVLTVLGGSITRIEVHHDAPAIAAYMQLVRAREAELDAGLKAKRPSC
jgi:ketosteroid isomerase-like protein